MIVTFLFGLNFKAVYLPFVLLIYEYVAQPARGIPWAMVIGLISGHLYYFLEDLYPATGGSRFIKTPQWLYRYFPLNTNPNGVRTSYGRVYIPPSPQVPTPMRGHNWGRGQQLGSGD
ncbi:hypothetical protein G9A89_023827 [Geosiphon pyriformis]|nr:hypothetical protein G9A89_023827 [Geosiphon pyriformis]